jgi:periplasmic protein TonB
VPAPPAPLRQDISVACPKQARPAFPERALDEGIHGTVRAEVRIRGARVVEVRIVSGPKIFHAPVRAALAQYQCQTSGSEEILASQEFEFKAE